MNFFEFDEYLELHFLIDYWYDEGVGIAAAMLSRFDDLAWKELSGECSSKSVEWQVRCAEVLDLVVHPVAVDVLLTLLSSQNDDVVVAAADSLRSRSEVQISAECAARLNRLIDQGSPPVKAVLVNFLERLGKR